jgi:hypothetical protein
MNSYQNVKNLSRFFWGMGLFVLSASTVAFVTDPYLMADIALVLISVYLMFTGLTGRKLE